MFRKVVKLQRMCDMGDDSNFSSEGQITKFFCRTLNQERIRNPLAQPQSLSANFKTSLWTYVFKMHGYKATEKCYKTTKKVI